jgi:D-alanine-D-alanine ligase
MGAADITPRVVVLYNDPVNDEEPSEVGVLGEVEDVVTAVQSLGRSVESVSISRETLAPVLASLEARREDTLVFNLCEGLNGQPKHEPLLAGLLEFHGIRFTGNASTTLSWALNKQVASAILRFSGVNTPESRVFRAAPDPAEVEGISFPVIVKPVREDGSLGITADAVVRTAPELRARVGWVLETYQQPALVERYLPGREFNLSVIGEGADACVLPVEEIVFKGYRPGEPRLLSHDAKWNTGSHDDVRTIPTCPALVDEELRTALASLALSAYGTFECRGYARIDTRLDTKGTPFVIDVNPNPDISRVAGLALAAKHAGFSYEEFVNTIMEAAWKRPL